MTSRRAQRRARVGAPIIATPGRELERRAVITWVMTAPDLEDFSALERRVVVELERGLVFGDLGPYTAAYRRFIEHPAAASTIGMGAIASNRVRRAGGPAEVRPGVPLGCGLPGSCFEQAAAFLMEHSDAAGITLVHGIVVEPEGPEGLPWSHCWVELRTGVVYDPSSGLYLERDGPHGWYAVLRAAALATYSSAEALDNLARYGRARQWPSTLAVHARVVDDWVRRLRHRVPGLVEWFERMTDADPVFRAQVDRLAERDDLLVVHALDHLARNPQLWQGHQPGVPWLHVVHPLGPLQ